MDGTDRMAAAGGREPRPRREVEGPSPTLAVAGGLGKDPPQLADGRRGSNDRRKTDGWRRRRSNEGRDDGKKTGGRSNDDGRDNEGGSNDDGRDNAGRNNDGRSGGALGARFGGLLGATSVPLLFHFLEHVPVVHELARCAFPAANEIPVRVHQVFGEVARALRSGVSPQAALDVHKRPPQCICVSGPLAEALSVAQVELARQSPDFRICDGGSKVTGCVVVDVHLWFGITTGKYFLHRSAGKKQQTTTTASVVWERNDVAHAFERAIAKDRRSKGFGQLGLDRDVEYDVVVFASRDVKPAQGQLGRQFIR